MTYNFISHSHNQHQINNLYAQNSLWIIVLIIMLLIMFTMRKRKKVLISQSDDLLSVDTGNTIRGIAIILLIIGHFSIKCVEGTIFIENAGRWAVIIFLYLSGLALSKTYGTVFLDRYFLLKRLNKIFLPFFISIVIFYLIEYFLLDRIYSIQKMALSLFLIQTTGPPNGPAWFITYIVCLYFMFYLTSKIKGAELFKIILLFSLCYGTSLIISLSPFLYSKFGIWTQYTIVFPISVGIGLFRHQIKNKIFLLHQSSPIILLLIAFLAFSQYFFQYGNEHFIHLIDLSVWEKFARSLKPISLLILLTIFVYVLDCSKVTSIGLNYLGKYSFEIFLVHMPFMVYYDFFLYRKPLFLSFFYYLCFILVLSILLSVVSKKLRGILLHCM